VQGFDKWMANFCVLVDGKPKRLRPDGRLEVKSENPKTLQVSRKFTLWTLRGKGPASRLL
jgi:hypothetical protein